jgi:hypothetical protein
VHEGAARAEAFRAVLPAGGSVHLPPWLALGLDLDAPPQVLPEAGPYPKHCTHPATSPRARARAGERPAPTRDGARGPRRVTARLPAAGGAFD